MEAWFAFSRDTGNVYAFFSAAPGVSTVMAAVITMTSKTPRRKRSGADVSSYHIREDQASGLIEEVMKRNGLFREFGVLKSWRLDQRTRNSDTATATL